MDFVVAVNNFGDTRSGGLAGPMGLFIIVLMSVATVLLIRNMNKRLRRLPDSFSEGAGGAREAEVARLEADLAAGTAAPRTGSVGARGASGADGAERAGSGVDGASDEAGASGTARGDSSTEGTERGPVA